MRRNQYALEKAAEEQQVQARLYTVHESVVKGSSSRFLSYFDHRQNYLLIDGNLKIMPRKDEKTPKR